VDDGFIVRDPADGILQQAQKIAVTGEPKGSFYVSWKVGQAAGADLAQHHCWLIGVRGRWVGQFRWILHEARDNSENRSGGRSFRNPRYSARSYATVTPPSCGTIALQTTFAATRSQAMHAGHSADFQAPPLVSTTIGYHAAAPSLPGEASVGFDCSENPQRNTYETGCHARSFLVLSPA
jgi:hypothetical protein